MKVQIKHGEYSPIGRELLEYFGPEQIEDKLEVERDLSMKVYCSTGEIPVVSLENESIEVPPFKIRGEFDANANDPSLITRGKERVLESMRRQEDTEVLKLLSAAVQNEHTISVKGSVIFENLTLAMSLLWEHDLDIHAVVTHPMRYKDLLNEGIIDSSRKDLFWNHINKACKGHIVIVNVPVLVSTMVPKNCVYVTAKPENLGVFGLFENPTFKVNKQKSENGKKHYDAECALGLCVTHEWGISRILVS